VSYHDRPTGWLRLVVWAIGVHSCGLGVALLVLPLGLTGFLGFPAAATPFFPAQSGAFLLALGICYLLALRHRTLIVVIVVSKTVAVLFLGVYAGLLGAPPMVWAAAAGDAALLAVTLVAWRLEQPVV
jgi:hypothetical protein